MQVGDSLAVNGVCLTAVAIDDTSLSVEIVRESLNRSNLGRLAVDDPVDLERPMPADGRFDGHVVQGHVDGVGIVDTITPEGDAQRMRISLPPALAPYVVEKGSITVDGVSLTVTAVSPPTEPAGWFEIVLIPHTLDVTVLGRRRPGTAVNLEVDVIAKYVERMLEVRR
jgi:riboflavin synthase